MRTNVEVTDLNDEQWRWLQRNLQVEYPGVQIEPRVCAVFTRADGTEERHVEMPVSVWLLAVFSLYVGRSADLAGTSATLQLTDRILG